MFKNFKQNCIEELVIGNSPSVPESESSSPQINDNKIYFCCDVNVNNVCSFNKSLRTLDKENQIRAVARQNDFDNVLFLEPIIVYINSSGGEVFSGISAMDTILSCKSPVYTVIDGCAASAATFISVVGTKRYITPHSYALIHQLSSGCWGQYEKIKEEVSNLDMFMEAIKEVYIKNTKISGEKISEILKKDIYFNANKCLELGLVDEIR
jgi:ATP-dependent Clp endopeptidase proteolytic subunit ClpP